MFLERVVEEEVTSMVRVYDNKFFWSLQGIKAFIYIFFILLNMFNLLLYTEEGLY